MDIRLLRYFLAVVNEGGILRAAETLHITQPTLSRQMMQLESELGEKLFERGKRIELTEAGMMFHRRAGEIVQLADKMKESKNSSRSL